MNRVLVVVLIFCLLALTGHSSVASPLNDNNGSPKHEIVELYTTSWCPYCKKAEAFLKANDIAYVNFDIEKDKAAARRKMQLDSRKGVPLAVIGGKAIYGFSERLYRTALDLDE